MNKRNILFSATAVLLSTLFLGACSDYLLVNNGTTIKNNQNAGIVDNPRSELHPIYGISINDTSDSGGQLIPEQAAYDVRHYDLNLTIEPAKKFISGTVVVKANILSPLRNFVLDLDSALKVSDIHLITNMGNTDNTNNTGKKKLEFEHKIFTAPQKSVSRTQPITANCGSNWIANISPGTA